MSVSSLVSFSVATYSTTQVTATWTWPSKGPYSGIAICGKTGGYPANIGDSRLYTGAGSNHNLGAKTSAIIGGLQPGKTYYFDDSGNMITGFQTINNQTYYFHTDGVMAKGELQLIDKKYTFNDQGVLIQEEELGKTFFHSDGSILATNAKKVIDVSKFQGDIDWEAVKNSDVDGAILRLGFGSYSLDSKFVQNLNEVKRLGIPYGIYLYSYAVDSAGAISEADFVLSMLNQYQIEPDLGIYYDIESNDITSYLTVMHYEEIIPTFLQKVRTSGYKTQVYTYKSLANEKLYSDKLKKEITWIAQYNDRCTWDGYYEGWQYTSSGNVPGIYGNVDISIFGNFVR